MTEYRCPACGEALCWSDEVYTDGIAGRALGCSQCVHRHYAAEWEGFDKDVCGKKSKAAMERWGN